MHPDLPAELCGEGLSCDSVSCQSHADFEILDMQQQRDVGPSSG